MAGEVLLFTVVVRPLEPGGYVDPATGAPQHLGLTNGFELLKLNFEYRRGLDTEPPVLYILQSFLK